MTSLNHEGVAGADESCGLDDYRAIGNTTHMYLLKGMKWFFSLKEAHFLAHPHMKCVCLLWRRFLAHLFKKLSRC
jgi:hypothetical protein